ncbi:hypothetical protein BMEGG_06064 [Priestia megaterium]|nr:PD-(D/E)XK nuclease family transposase [Priestia aryabhattai]
MFYKMEKRTLYYWSKMYSSQMKEGMDYEELCQTIKTMALGMIHKGIDTETISELTGLSQEEINSLRH